MSNRVKIDWLENDIWNGKTGEIVWEDPEDNSETSTVVVKIIDFPTKDGFQEVEQNFERRFVKPVEEAEKEEEFAEEEIVSEEPAIEQEEETTVEETPAEEIKHVDEETEVEEALEESHEDELECCICHKHFTGHGNNPYPICDEGRCCDDCNWHVVIPARIKQLDNREVPSDIDFEDEEFEECEDCREYPNIPDDLD